MVLHCFMVLFSRFIKWILASSEISIERNFYLLLFHANFYLHTTPSLIIRIICNKVSSMKIGREHKGNIHNPVNDTFRFRSKLQQNSITSSYKLIIHCRNIQLNTVGLIVTTYSVQDS